MSEEDAFLVSIAADRADRTRLLVFADWLADRSDPREEFVRLHARLLDMDGMEPEFGELETEWNRWIFGREYSRVPHPKIYDRWLDALCRVCTTADVEKHEKSSGEHEDPRAERIEYSTLDHIDANSEPFLVLYRGHPRNYDGPFAFVAETLLMDLWQDPFIVPGITALDSCYPVTGGHFWQTWSGLCANLHDPPLRPETAGANLFLGAQYIGGRWGDNWGMVAAYQHDYFALFWSTTA